MCGLGSLDVVEITRSGKLGLGENLGPLRHDFSHFEKVMGKCVYFGAVFGHFGALIAARRVTDVRQVLPGRG